MSQTFARRLSLTSYLARALAFLDREISLPNEIDDSVSAGQKAEYLFLRKNENAETFDAVLIDEPESSFDNPFLFEEIRDHVKRISNDVTVFCPHSITSSAYR